MDLKPAYLFSIGTVGKSRNGDRYYVTRNKTWKQCNTSSRHICKKHAHPGARIDSKWNTYHGHHVISYNITTPHLQSYVETTPHHDISYDVTTPQIQSYDDTTPQPQTYDDIQKQFKQMEIPKKEYEKFINMLKNYSIESS